MRKRFLTLALVVLFAVTAGCSGPGAGESGRAGTSSPGQGRMEGGVLRLSMFSAPKGIFNPILAEDQYDANVIGLVFDGLLTRNERLEPVCNLCERYEVSPDNRTVTFALRRDVRWHDGRPFTARDVAFTFRAMLHPDYPGVRTHQYAALAGVEKMLDRRDALARQVAAKQISREEAARRRAADWATWLRGDGQRAIRVIDDYTIAFSTSEPYAPLLDHLAIPIIPAHVYEGSPVGELAAHPAVKQPIGTGPYRFVRYVTDQYVEFRRHEEYHRGKPAIPTVIYKIVHQDLAVGQLMAGELDLIPIHPADVALVKEDPNISVFSRPEFGYQYMGLNHDHPILQDKRVRQALMYAIDREGIVNRLLRGYGTVVNSHVSGVPWAQDPKGLNPYPYDPARAAALLAEAGWSRKNEEGYLVRDGRVFAITLKYPSGNRVREASAPLIQANLKAVGIKVELQMMEAAALTTAVFDQREMDAWLLGWSLGPDPDPGAIFLPDNKWGRATGWINPQSEALIRQGTRLLRPAERKPVYAAWAKILNDELPYIFLYSPHALEAVRTDRVKGLKPDARGALWNIWQLWIPREKQ